MPTTRKASQATTLTGANVATGDKIFILDASDTTDDAAGTTKAITAAELIIAVHTLSDRTRVNNVAVVVGSNAITFATALASTSYDVMAFVVGSDNSIQVLGQPGTKLTTGFTYSDIQFAGTLYYTATIRN